MLIRFESSDYNKSCEILGRDKYFMDYHKTYSGIRVRAIRRWFGFELVRTQPYELPVCVTLVGATVKEATIEAERLLAL